MTSELKRKLFHLCGFIYVIGLHYLERVAYIQAVLLIWMVVCLFEIMRRKNEWFKERIKRKWGHIMRDEEQSGLTGAFWMPIGVLSAALLLPAKNLLMAAILFLLLGDTVASLVGKSMKGATWPGSPKRISGSLACFLVCFAVAVYCLRPEYAWAGIVLTAAVATVAEFNGTFFNDNFLIPFLSALVMLFL